GAPALSAGIPEIQRHPGPGAAAARRAGGSMLHVLNRRPRCILMTVDAVGGVWTYALSLARALASAGNAVVLAGSGPLPTDAQVREAEEVATIDWLETPLDWMAGREAELEGLGAELSDLARRHEAELLHLNAPAQASGIEIDMPVVTVSHSCVA